MGQRIYPTVNVNLVIETETIFLYIFLLLIGYCKD